MRLGAEALFGSRAGAGRSSQVDWFIGFRKERTKVATLDGIAVTSESDGIVVVSFTDEHDLATRDDLSRILDGLVREHDLVVADFSDALFVDSSTLRVLLAAHKLAVGRGTTFRLVLGDDCAVRRTFEIAGLLEELGWASTTAEAINGSRPDRPETSDAAAA